MDRNPAPVVRAIFDGYDETEKTAQQDPGDYPIWGYAAWKTYLRRLREGNRLEVPPRNPQRVDFREVTFV